MSSATDDGADEVKVFRRLDLGLISVTVIIVNY